MSGQYEDKVYGLLSRGTVAAGEAAVKLDITHNTALKTFMRLALTKKDVHYKNSGRIHLFWREIYEHLYIV